MIPVIDIKVKECCEFGYNLSKQSNWIIGQAYCYDWNTTKEAALKKGLNLDSFLTFQIGYHLAMKNPKGSFLVWYAPIGEMFFLTATRKGSKTIPIRKLEDFIDFKGGNKDLIVPVKTKRRNRGE